MQPKKTKFRKAHKGRIHGTATAFTTYGTCGVKVWLFKGEIMEHDPMAQDKKLAEGESGGGRPSSDR